MIETIEHTIGKHALFDAASPALLMVSGGSDSTALAYIMADLHARGLVGPLACLHVNHKLRGRDADVYKRQPEIPEADFNEAKVAFEESLGSNFGTASILEEEEEAPTLTSASPSRMSKVLFTMRQISQSDHRTAGILALTLGAFGMHKFYLGYHEQGFLLLLATIILATLSSGIGILAIWMVAGAEGIIYLSKSPQEFEQIYVEGTHNWF